MSFFSTMFMTPALPSGLYFADGLVIISTDSMFSAGICSSTWPRFSSVSPEGLPLIHISTFELFLKDTPPSLSTSTDGMPCSTSVASPPAAAMLWSTENTFLSISKRPCEPCATTSTSLSILVSSYISMLPSFTFLFFPVMLNVFVASA